MIKKPIDGQMNIVIKGFESGIFAFAIAHATAIKAQNRHAMIA